MATEDEDDLSIVGLLKAKTEMEGHKPGTEEFDRRLRQLKVVRCREFRGLFGCSDCIAYDNCELAKQVLRDHYGY